MSLNLIFANYTGSKNQGWNRQKIKSNNQFREIEILENQVQIDRGIVGIHLFDNILWKILCGHAIYHADHTCNLISGNKSNDG